MKRTVICLELGCASCEVLKMHESRNLGIRSWCSGKVTSMKYEKGMGTAGNRTPGLAHPKGESYH
eukprot:525415-Pleurochrysis_carterae.AAC.1